MDASSRSAPPEHQRTGQDRRRRVARDGARRSTARPSAARLAALACIVVTTLLGGLAASAVPYSSPVLAGVRRPAPTPTIRTAPPPVEPPGTFPAQVPIVVEVDDPVGDVSRLPVGRVVQAAALPSDIDITHLGAWSADGMLHAEVTFAGRPPSPDGPATAIRLVISGSGRRLEAVVCTTADLCAADDLVSATTSVIARASGWRVEYEIGWSAIARRLGAPAPGAGYEVFVTASVIGRGSWIDWAPGVRGIQIGPEPSAAPAAPKAILIGTPA